MHGWTMQKPEMVMDKMVNKNIDFYFKEFSCRRWISRGEWRSYNITCGGYRERALGDVEFLHYESIYRRLEKNLLIWKIK